MKNADKVLSGGIRIGYYMRGKAEENPRSPAEQAQLQTGRWVVGLVLARQRVVPMNPHRHALKTAHGHHNRHGPEVADHAAGLDLANQPVEKQRVRETRGSR